jgi:gas vesicle protein
MEDEAMSTNSDLRSNNSAIIGFLVGSIVGAGVALLLAPTTGEETRRRIGDTARRVGGDAKNRIDDIKVRLARTTEDVKSDLHDAVEAGKNSAQRMASRMGDSSHS